MQFLPRQKNMAEKCSVFTVSGRQSSLLQRLKKCVCVSLVGRLWRRESDTVETHFSACHTSLRANYPPDTQAEKVCEAALSKLVSFLRGKKTNHGAVIEQSVTSTYQKPRNQLWTSEKLPTCLMPQTLRWNMCNPINISRRLLIQDCLRVCFT